ncbi:hypothetical protein H634G_06592 [Metarhizium anisopliae BRIP 53293]|uniref:VOC domain-containing protein n=1 Tax=Metarhizium anisopliae BRIP 53293 TaxID=1291518 RepID=A0A0D9NVI5_METAN|nr:hypothetical protein H634G_06592 [Metarhizium anisopliae BRIP 53293]KJK95515.1 hypothetical protein H633G_00586 [Metarhizium anisopliae BRIP 53284]
MAGTETNKISLVRPAFVTYVHKDVDRACRFLDDFGLVRCGQTGDKFFYRGYGVDPWVYSVEKGDSNEFGGAGFVVESEQDLQRASRILPNASEIHNLDSPGGGKCVTFRDPVDGFRFYLVCDQVLNDEPIFPSPQLKFNFPTNKFRFNETKRFEKGPAPVHKLGHFGLCVTNFDAFFEYFTTHFNFRPSDFIFDENGRNITAFCRLDRGLIRVDHHCFFFFEGPKAHVHHASFETYDYNIQTIGHDWLRDGGFDPSGFIVEHYVDGDLFDNTVPVNRTRVGPDNLHIWANFISQAQNYPLHL